MASRLKREFEDGPVPYRWWLAGPDGASFELCPVVGRHSDHDVLAAKREIRRDRDVVGRIRVSWKRFDDVYERIL